MRYGGAGVGQRVGEGGSPEKDGRCRHCEGGAEGLPSRRADQGDFLPANLRGKCKVLKFKNSFRLTLDSNFWYQMYMQCT